MAAPHDQAGGRDDAVGALAARQAGALLDAVDRDFGAAAEDGKDRTVLQEVDRVVAPFTGGNLAAVEAEQAIELTPVEGHSVGGGEGYMGLAPMKLAGFGIARTKGHRRLLLSSTMCHPPVTVDDRAIRECRQGA